MASRATIEPANAQGYRSPTVLLSPGVLFRTGRAITVTSLVVVALAAIALVVMRVTVQHCTATDESCATWFETTSFRWTDWGISLEWQEAWFEFATPLGLLVLVIDAAAACWFVRTRIVRLDPVRRILTTQERWWPRKAVIHHIALDDILFVEVRRSSLVLQAIEVIDRAGRPYPIGNPRTGRKRQRAVAARIETAIAGRV